jgi:hypothetical protein
MEKAKILLQTPKYHHLISELVEESNEFIKKNF